MEVAGRARFRNLILSAPGGFSWNESGPTSDMVPAPGSVERIVLSIDVPNGGCITIDCLPFEMSVSELQCILTELQEQDCDFAENSSIRAKLSVAALWKKRRWIPNKILAQYILRREISVANLLRMLKGETTAHEYTPSSATESSYPAAKVAWSAAKSSHPIRVAHSDYITHSRSNECLACSLDSAKEVIRNALDLGEKRAHHAVDTEAPPATASSRNKAQMAHRRQFFSLSKCALPNRGIKEPMLGSTSRGLTNDMLRNIENGIVPPNSHNAATKRLNLFFSGMKDAYSCSWPHTKGAQYCTRLFDDKVDKHYVRHSIGGYRVAAREFAEEGHDLPGGTIQTVYANEWGTRHGRHFHRKSRGRMATITIIPVYDDFLAWPVDHAGPVSGPSGWFADAVHFADRPRPGEFIKTESPARHSEEAVCNAIQVICFAGAKLCIKGSLPGYSQTSHQAPVMLLPRHTKLDDAASQDNSNSAIVGMVHLEQRVAFRKFPVHVKLLCQHEGGGHVASAVAAIACEVIPADMPHLGGIVEQDLEAEVRSAAKFGDVGGREWWKDENGLFELPIPGRCPDGELRCWMRMEDGVTLQTLAFKGSNELEVKSDTGSLFVRTVQNVHGGAAPALMEVKVAIRRPPVRVIVRINYADSSGPVNLVRTDERGRHIPLDDYFLTTTDTSVQTPTFHIVRPSTKWRIAARLARRKSKFSGEMNLERTGGWLIGAVTLPDEPAPIESLQAGFVITVRNPEASMLIPRHVLLGYVVDAGETDQVNEEQRSIEPAQSCESHQAQVHLIPESLRWPQRGWVSSTSVTILFRKLPARLTLDVRDFCGMPITGEAIAIKQTSINGLFLSDDAAEDAGMALHIPGHSPFATWTLDAGLTEGLKLLKAIVTTADTRNAFSESEESVNRHPLQWQLPSGIQVSLQAGTISAVRLFVAMPPVRVEIIALNTVDGKEIMGGPPGWVLGLLDISLTPGTDERYGFENVGWSDEAETARVAAQQATGRISLVVHRFSCIRLVEGSLPKGFDFDDAEATSRASTLVPSEHHWPQPSWRQASPCNIRLRKLTAGLRLIVTNDVTRDLVPKRLIGDILVLHDDSIGDNRETNGLNATMALVSPAALRAQWGAGGDTHDAVVQISVPGFMPTCNVMIQIRLKDGTSLGTLQGAHLETDCETELRIEVPLEATAPRIVVAPLKVDVDVDGNGEPLSHAAPGWLFYGAEYNPAPPLDVVALEGGGVECRITRDVDVRLSEYARSVLKYEILPGYDVIENDSFSKGVVHLLFPDNSETHGESHTKSKTSEIGDETTPDDPRANAVPITENFAQLAQTASVTGAGSFITVNIGKQPASIRLQTLWLANGSPAPICGLRGIQLDGKFVNTQSIDTSLEILMHVPGRGSREKAPTSRCALCAQESRGWRIKIARCNYAEDDDKDNSGLDTPRSHAIAQGIVLPFAIVAGSMSVITIVVDDSALWARLTRVWLSRKLAGVFRRNLATLEVFVAWENTGQSAPLEVLKNIWFGQFRCKAGSIPRDLLCAVLARRRESPCLRRPPLRLAPHEKRLQRIADNGISDSAASARQRLRRRLLLRERRRRSPALTTLVLTYSAKDIRSLFVEPPRKRSWTMLLECEVEGTHVDTNDGTRICVMAQKTTSLRILVSDDSLWHRLSRKRAARRWHTAFSTQTIKVIAAALPSGIDEISLTAGSLVDESRRWLALDQAKKQEPLDAGSWLLNSLEVTPSPKYAHAFQEPGFPVRLHIEVASEFVTHARRPGFELAGVEICNAPFRVMRTEKLFERGHKFVVAEEQPNATSQHANDTSSLTLKNRVGNGTLFTRIQLPLERSVVCVFFRRLVAKVRFEVVFQGRPNCTAPIESIRGIGLAPMPGRTPETSIAIARPSREWIKRQASDKAAVIEPELSVYVFAGGSHERAPEAEVQVVVVASRSWEVAAIASEQGTAKIEVDINEPVTEQPSFFSTQRQTQCVLPVRVSAGSTHVVQIRVSDTRLYLGLCLRQFVRRIVPLTSIRPLRWRWSHVSGSTDFERLYTGALLGDRADPKVWAKPGRGWTTKTSGNGKIEYIYTDYTSAPCAGHSTDHKRKADAKIRRAEWRRALAERRRKKAAHAQRLRERSAEERAAAARKYMDAVDLLKVYWEGGTMSMPVGTHT